MDYVVLACDTHLSGRYWPLFGSNMPSATSTLNTRGCFSESSIPMYQNTRHHTSEDNPKLAV